MLKNNYKKREKMMDVLLVKKHKMQLQKDALLKQIEKLDHDMIVVQSKYGALYNASTLISGLPNELLCLIFFYALDTPSPDPKSDDENSSPPPLMEVIFTHVCRHWRSVALGYTPLWSFFQYDGSFATRIPIDRFEAYMQRSTYHLIDLWLNFSYVFPDDEARLLDLVTKHVNRWRRISIVSNEDNFGFFAPMQQTLEDLDAPNLEYFAFRPNLIYTFDHTKADTPIIDIKPKIFKLGAPKLSHVYLDATAPPTFLPPLSNVTVLRLEVDSTDGEDQLDWPAFLQILDLPFLASLSLAGRVFNPPIRDYRNGNIMMKNLKHLRFSGDECVDYILSYLTAPVLETLVLSNLSLPPLPDPPASISLPSLHTLHLLECTSLSLHYLRFLAKGSRNLIHLIIAACHDPDDFALFYLNEEFEAGRKYWMSIQTLTTFLGSQEAEGIVPYLDFIRPRKRKNPLFSLRISKLVDSEWQLWQYPKLQKLQKFCTIEHWSRGTDILSSRWPPDAAIRVPLDEVSVVNVKFLPGITMSYFDSDATWKVISGL